MQQTFQEETQKDAQLTLKATIWWQLLVLVAISMPYLIGWLTTPADKVFSWALLNPDDVGVYVSAMNQGAAGNWLYHFTYSPEPWQPRFMYTLYLVLGKITAIIARPSVVWFHFWRLVLSLVSLNALIFWIRTALPRPRWQWTAWFIILFGGGLGWLVAILSPANSGHLPDIGMSEWIPLLALINTPHFALGLGLMAFVFACLIRAERTETTRNRVLWAIAGAIAAVLTALTYTFQLVIIVLVIGVYLVLRSIQLNWKSWRHWWVGAIFLTPLIPFLYYYAFWDNGDPYWERYVQVDNVIHPPAFWAAVIGLGFLTPLAIAGACYWIKQKHTALLPIWVAVNFLALYLPFIQFSGRFGLGMLIPIATLAAVGLETIVLPWLARTKFFVAFSRLTPTPYASLRRVSILLLIPSVLMAILLLAKGPLVHKGFPYYWPEADVRAAKWLGERSDVSDLTLSYYPMGNYLPQVYSGKVFMGQQFITTDLDNKLELFERFWDGSMSEEERQSFLTQWDIKYIFSGSFEEPYRNGTVPLGSMIYQEDDIEIYQLP